MEGAWEAIVIAYLLCLCRDDWIHSHRTCRLTIDAEAYSLTEKVQWYMSECNLRQT